MIEAPEYWSVIQAAKYLGVSPWELIEQPSYWLHASHVCMKAEHELQERASKKKNKK